MPLLFLLMLMGQENKYIRNFNPGDFREPAWSPDGTQIIFIIQDNIFLAVGENNVPLANTAAIERNPSWSITGKIVYERDNEIWTMNGDGTDQALFSGITQSVPKSPKWSPDGSKLAFTSGGEIWVINSDDTNERRITNNSTDDKEPDWSPDGTKLIYQKGSTGIAVVNLDGTNETNLTVGVDDRTPAWSGDGVNIAFIRKGSQKNGLYIMDATPEQIKLELLLMIMFPVVLLILVEERNWMIRLGNRLICNRTLSRSADELRNLMQFQAEQPSA